ncbi:olfactory receptor 1052-like [Rana temporaria]|uniref:olfactory receptor 1052-like n=1 Tax=Rana temporaria TaxID=8407 RepID=UPI001AAD6AC2|nr:olfactory receptor 1052-like [Rana temporaria]
MGNQTILKDLILSGLSDLPTLQLPLFLFFLLIYLLTLIWNSLIIVLIVTESHLHVPMYFFLGNMGGLDLCCSSLTVPRMLFDLHTETRKITISACITQVFFFTFCTTSEVSLLAVMSYDRFSAICQPLHYTQIMSWKVCGQLMTIVGCLSFTNSLVHTLYTCNLTFCGSDIIESFFCDLPQLLQISCSDISINVLLLFIFGGSITIGCLTLTFLSYVYIFKTVLKMKVGGGRRKVFSTCTPHLTVMFIFYGSVFFNYFQLNESHRFAGNKGVSVFYTVILPLLNPLIYSLRNQDIRKASRDVLKKILPNAV